MLHDVQYVLNGTYAALFPLFKMTMADWNVFFVNKFGSSRLLRFLERIQRASIEGGRAHHIVVAMIVPVSSEHARSDARVFDGMMDHDELDQLIDRSQQD
jgi:hypothetical protein